MDYSKCMRNKCKECKFRIKCFEYKPPKEKIKKNKSKEILNDSKNVC